MKLGAKRAIWLFVLTVAAALPLHLIFPRATPPEVPAILWTGVVIALATESIGR